MSTLGSIFVQNHHLPKILCFNFRNSTFSGYRKADLSKQTKQMQKTHRAATDLEFRRRLILARRMVTRTRAEVACALCKARKTKCSDYRPCSRCSILGLVDCWQEEMQTSRFVHDDSRFHEDGPEDNTSAGSILISSVPSASQTLPASRSSIIFPPFLAIPPSHLADHRSAGALPHESHQVPHPTKALLMMTGAAPNQKPCS